MTKAPAWHNIALLFIVSACAALATFLCLFLDAFNANQVTVSPMYAAVLVAAFVPMAHALWFVRKPSLWFFFGVWLGTLWWLPSVPWNTEKKFFLAAHRLHEGMSPDEVRQTMDGFGEVEVQPDIVTQRLHDGWTPMYGDGTKQILAWRAGGVIEFVAKTQAFNYAWDRFGDADLDNVTVTFRSDRLTKIEISTE